MKKQFPKKTERNYLQKYLEKKGAKTVHFERKKNNLRNHRAYNEKKEKKNRWVRYRTLQFSYFNF